MVRDNHDTVLGERKDHPMNFASKKLKEFYANTSNISAREEALLAENRKLKSKNKRLSTAMIFLVDHIETRLPIYAGKTSGNATPAEPKPVKAAPVDPPKPPKKKIVGKAWTPEKLDTTPDTSSATAKRSAPLPKQKISADGSVQSKIQAPPPTISIEKPVERETSPSQTVSNELSPDLSQEEASLLAIPKKDSSKEGLQTQPDATFVKRDAKKTTAQEASMTYLAVSMAASPVPEIEDAEDKDGKKSQVSLQIDIMREAMLRRVNRLRW